MVGRFFNSYIRGQFAAWLVAVFFFLMSFFMILSSYHLNNVMAAGTGTNVFSTADSVRIATGDFNATLDVASSGDITQKMGDNVLSGTAATVDLQETTGTTSDRYVSISETVASASYDGEVILRVYVASIDQPLRLKVYPYASTDLRNVILASGDSYPISPNTLTSSDVYKPIIDRIPRSTTLDASTDAGWININVTHIAQFLKPSTTLKLKLGLEMPSGTNVKASITEIRLNFTSNKVPHDNYIMLTTDWCGQCHSRHNGGQKAILRAPAEKASADIFTSGQQTKEEAVCYVCHDGTGSTKDLRTEFRKAEAGTGGAMRIWRYLGAHDRKESTGSGDTNVYVADSTAGLVIINVANPASPVITATIDTPGTAEDVFVFDNHAFIADGLTGLTVVDVKDPQYPRIVGTYDTNGFAAGVWVSSKDAYVASGTGGVYILNITNKSAITLTNNIVGATSADAVAVQAGVRPYTTNSGYGAPATYVEPTYLLVARDSSGMTSYNVTNPAVPATGDTVTPGTVKDMFVADANGMMVWAAVSTSGVQGYEFNEGTFSAKGAIFDTSGDATGIYVLTDQGTTATNDPLVFVADGFNGVSILEHGGANCAGCSANMTNIGSYNTTGSADSISAAGGYMYVGDEASGLQILSYSDPRNPTLAATYNTPASAKGVSPTYSTHVECFDCHNPHLVTYNDRFRGKQGINASGEVTGWGKARKRLFQFEICFRCHGNSVAQSVGRMVEDIPNNFPFSNKVREFNPSNSAYHPVEGPGRNRSVSLNNQLQGATSTQKYSLSTADTIVCADCHNNDLTENTAGPVANYSYISTNMTQTLGLHGSKYTTNKRAFFFNDFDGPTSFSASNFNLCFRCHDSTCFTAGGTNSFGDCTNFYDNINGKGNLHELHLQNKIGTARATCKNCHYNMHSNVDSPNTMYRINNVLYFRAPNSVPTRLVNFSPDLNSYNDDGTNRRKPEWWLDTTTRERRCYVDCHGTLMGGSSGAGGRRATYRITDAASDVPNN